MRFFRRRYVTKWKVAVLKGKGLMKVDGKFKEYAKQNPVGNNLINYLTLLCLSPAP